MNCNMLVCRATIQEAVKWNHINSGGFILSPLFAGAWECGEWAFFLKLRGLHMCTICTHVQSHTHAPSAPPSNQPSTHTHIHTYKCKHRHKAPINPRRNWHWRTLKGLCRFVLIYGDWFLCQQMNCREGVRELTSDAATAACSNLWVPTSGLIIVAERDNLSSSVSR